MRCGGDIKPFCSRLSFLCLWRHFTFVYYSKFLYDPPVQAEPVKLYIVLSKKARFCNLRMFLSVNAAQLHQCCFNFCRTILSIQIKGLLTRDSRVQVFSVNQFPPGSWASHWGHCEFLEKFGEIFASLCLSPVSLLPAINYSTESLTPVIKPCLGFSSIPWHRRLILRRKQRPRRYHNLSRPVSLSRKKPNWKSRVRHPLRAEFLIELERPRYL